MTKNKLIQHGCARAFKLALCTLAVCLFIAGEAKSNEDTSASFAELQARRDALFQASLADPTNLDIAFEYAMLSAQVGDNEAAISTLERMLIFAPGLPRVQLELAALYYRIGAFETAKHYLDEVRKQELPATVRARVDEFAVAVDREARPYRFSGTIQGGIQTHSNANLAPNQEAIILNGLPFTLGEGAKAQSDSNLFALAQLNYVHDLPAQGALFEVDTTLYATSYFELSRLSMNLIEVAAGPSFNLGRYGWDKARLGVYGILGASTLDGSLFSRTYGVGTRLRTQLSDRTLLDTLLEARSIDYSNSASYPTVSLQSGESYRAQAQLTTLISADLMALFTFEARFVDGEADFKSFSAYALSARLNYAFQGATGGILADNAPWTVSFAIGGLTRNFDGPDPDINAADTENDNAYWIEATLGVPLERDFTAYVTAQYIGQNSNYPTRDYDGATLTIGVSKRF